MGLGSSNPKRSILWNLGTEGNKAMGNQNGDDYEGHFKNTANTPET